METDRKDIQTDHLPKRKGVQRWKYKSCHRLLQTSIGKTKRSVERQFKDLNFKSFESILLLLKMCH